MILLDRSKAGMIQTASTASVCSTSGKQDPNMPVHAGWFFPFNDASVCNQFEEAPSPFSVGRRAFGEVRDELYGALESISLAANHADSIFSRCPRASGDHHLPWYSRPSSVYGEYPRHGGGSERSGRGAGHGGSCEQRYASDGEHHDRLDRKLSVLELGTWVLQDHRRSQRVFES